MWKGYHPIIFCVWKECEIHLLMLFTDKKILISISYFPFLNVTQSPTQVMFLSYITALTLFKYFYRKKEEMWKKPMFIYKWEFKICLLMQGEIHE